MGSLAILLPIALLFFAIAAALFWWAVSDKQYQDLDREGQRILFDTDSTTPTRQNTDTPRGDTAEQSRRDA